MLEVRVLVVDDHALFRSAAAAVVKATDGFEVVGTAESFEAAGDFDGVDLVLMDVNLPGCSGIDAARILTDQGESPVVVLLSTYDESMVDWAGCGAVDYITKSAFSPARLMRSWRTAHP